MTGGRCSSAPARRPSHSGAGSPGRAASAQHGAQSPLAVKGNSCQRPEDVGGPCLSAVPPLQQHGIPGGRAPSSKPPHSRARRPTVDGAPSSQHPLLVPIRTTNTADGGPQAAQVSRVACNRDRNRHSASPASTAAPTPRGSAPPQKRLPPWRPRSATPAPLSPHYLVGPQPYRHVDARAPIMPRLPPGNFRKKRQPNGNPSCQQQQHQQAVDLPIVQGKSVDLVHQAAGRHEAIQQSDQAAHRSHLVPEAMMEADEEYWEWLFKEQDGPESPYGSAKLRALLSAVSPQFSVKRPEGYIPVTPSDISSSRYVRSDMWGWSGPNTPSAAAAHAAMTIIAAAYPNAQVGATTCAGELPAAPSPQRPLELTEEQQQQQQQEEEEEDGLQELRPISESASPARLLHRKLSRRAAAAVASIVCGGEAAFGRLPSSHLTSSHLTYLSHQQPERSQVLQQQPIGSRVHHMSKDAPASTTAMTRPSQRIDTVEVTAPAAAATAAECSSATSHQQPQRNHNVVVKSCGPEEEEEEVDVEEVPTYPLGPTDPYSHRSAPRWNSDPRSQSASRTAREPGLGPVMQPLWAPVAPEVWKEATAATAAAAVAQAALAEMSWRLSQLNRSAGSGDEDCGEWAVCMEPTPGFHELNHQCSDGKSRVYQQKLLSCDGTCASNSASSVGAAVVSEPFERMPSYQCQSSRQLSHGSRKISRQVSREPDRAPLLSRLGSEISQGSLAAEGDNSRPTSQLLPFRRVPSRAWPSDSEFQEHHQQPQPLRGSNEGSGVEHRPTGRSHLTLDSCDPHSSNPRMSVAALTCEKESDDVASDVTTAAAVEDKDWPRGGRGNDIKARGAKYWSAASPGLSPTLAPGSAMFLTPTKHGDGMRIMQPTCIAGEIHNPTPVAGGGNVFRTPSPCREGGSTFRTPGPTACDSGGVFRTPSPSIGGGGSGGGSNFWNPVPSGIGGLGSGSGGHGWGSGGYGGASPGGFRGPLHCLRARSADHQRPSAALLPHPHPYPYPRQQQQQSSIPGSPAPSGTPSSRRTPPPVVPLIWEPPPPPQTVVPLLVLVAPELQNPHHMPSRRESPPSGHSGSSTPSCPGSPYGRVGDNEEMCTTAVIGALMSLSPPRRSGSSSTVEAAAATAASGGGGRPLPRQLISAPPGGPTAVGPQQRMFRKQQQQPHGNSLLGFTEAVAPSYPAAEGRPRSTAPADPKAASGTADPVKPSNRVERLKSFCSILEVPPQLRRDSSTPRAGWVPSPSPSPSSSARSKVMMALYAPKITAVAAVVKSPTKRYKSRLPPSAAAAAVAASNRCQAVLSPPKRCSPAGQHNEPAPSVALRAALWSPSVGAVQARRRWTVTSECSGGGAISEPGELNSALPSARPQPSSRPLSALRRCSAHGDRHSSATAAVTAACERQAPVGSDGGWGRPHGSCDRRQHASVGSQRSSIPVGCDAVGGHAGSRCGGRSSSGGTAAALGAAVAGHQRSGDSTSSSSDCGGRRSRGAPSTLEPCGNSVESWSGYCASAASGSMAIPASVSSSYTSAVATAASISRRVVDPGAGVGGMVGHEGRVRYDGIPRAVHSDDSRSAAVTSHLRAAMMTPLPAGDHQPEGRVGGDFTVVGSGAVDVVEDRVRRNLVDSFGRHDGTGGGGGGGDFHLLATAQREAGSAPAATSGNGVRGSGPPRRSLSSSQASPRADVRPSRQPSTLSRPRVDLLPCVPGEFTPSEGEAAGQQGQQQQQQAVSMLRPRRRQWGEPQQPDVLGVEGTGGGWDLQKSGSVGDEAVAMRRRRSETSISTGGSGGREAVPLSTKPPLAPQPCRTSAASAASSASIVATTSTLTESRPSKSASHRLIVRNDGSRPPSATSSVCSEDSNGGDGSGHNHHNHHWSYHRNRERALLISSALAAAAAVTGQVESPASTPRMTC